MKDIDKVTIPKCIRYNEMFDIDETINEIIKSRANLVICHHNNEMKYYQQLEDVKFVYIGHCANSNIFKESRLRRNNVKMG